LEEYDKKALKFKFVSNVPVPGIFCQKKKADHYNVVKMDRTFLGEKSRIIKPSKSRVTKTLCIYLCQKSQAPAQRSDEGNINNTLKHE